MNNRHRGFSIIELMVAVTLGLILLAGVLQVFINSKQGYQVQQSNSSSQERTRFAIEYLSRYILLADLWDGAEPALVTIAGGGTPSFTGIAGTKCVDAWVINPADGVHGYLGASALSSVADPPQSCLNATGGNYVPNSDVLAIRYVDPSTYVSTACLNASAVSASCPNGNPDTATSGYWVRSLVGRRAEIFKSSTYATAASDLPGDYDSGILNYSYQAAIFYLQNIDNGQGVVPTLYMLVTQGSTLVYQPLAEGVEMLKFEYGVDSNGDLSVDQYLPACPSSGTSTGCVGSSGWPQVISVRVSMIVRGDTLDNYTDTQTYQMTDSFCYASSATATAALPSACAAAGATVATYDQTTAKYQRRLVVREIQLRNRVRQ